MKSASILEDLPDNYKSFNLKIFLKRERTETLKAFSKNQIMAFAWKSTPISNQCKFNQSYEQCNV